MTQQELLLKLKDITAPSEPEWWLLAPGYMIVSALILVMIGAAMIVLRRQRSRRSYSAALQTLEQIRWRHRQSQDSLKLARELAQWLKQVALLAFPQSQLESITGSNWLAFLDSSIDDDSFTMGAGKVFAQEIYREHAQADAERLLELCERWLFAVKPRLLRRGQD